MKIKTQTHFLLYFILCLTFCFSKPAFSENFYVIQHKIKKGDDFTSILKQYVLKESIINKSNSMIKVTINKNPHIKDWRNLPLNKIVKIYISKQYIDVTSYSRYKEKIKKIKKKQEKKILATNSDQPAPKKSFGMSIFYMMSFGAFSQTASDATQTTLSQNSPITLGSLISWKPKKKDFFYSGSMYFSSLTPFESNVSNEKTDIPMELGVNAYFNYTGVKFLQALYSGLDYERFSPFNLGTIAVNTDGQNTKSIGFDEVYVLYLTAGIGKVFMIANRAVFMKISASKSLISTHKTAIGGTELSKEYDGFKSILYINYRFTKRFFVHGFYKLHIMTGSNDLNIGRYGFGFGVNLF